MCVVEVAQDRLVVHELHTLYSVCMITSGRNQKAAAEVDSVQLLPPHMPTR